MKKVGYISKTDKNFLLSGGAGTVLVTDSDPRYADRYALFVEDKETEKLKGLLESYKETAVKLNNELSNMIDSIERYINEYGVTGDILEYIADFVYLDDIKTENLMTMLGITDE